MTLKFNSFNPTLTDQQIADLFKSNESYISHLQEVAKAKNYDYDESSINLPFDQENFKIVKELAEQKKSAKLKYIFVIGIGGSNLGTMAIYQALFGQLDYLNAKLRLPKMVFADTVSTKLVSQINDIIQNQLHAPDEVIVNIVSKSGGSVETSALFEVIYRSLKDKFGEAIKSQIVVTSDKGSKLYTSALERNFSVLPIPKKVGGRYSVFSAVGLFPLAVANVDVEALLKGAAEMRDNCISSDLDKNIAFKSASLAYLHSKNGLTINNNFFFNPELESVGKWYRQLMGESIGKEFDVNGNKVNAGITPIVSIGSTDLHSMAQLYFGGPKDKFTTFVYAKGREELTIPNIEELPLIDGIAGKSVGQIMDIIYKSVIDFYKTNNLPYTEVFMDEVNEYNLGSFLQFKMIEMMYLAKLLNLNGFDQPNVEEYKSKTMQLFNVQSLS